jgi:hypothetical protein
MLVAYFKEAQPQTNKQTNKQTRGLKGRGTPQTFSVLSNNDCG